MGLLGPDLISMSECVTDLVPANIDGWDDWFADPASAQRARVQAGRPGLRALAVGVSSTDAPALLKEMADNGYGEHSVPERLSGGGVAHGFEAR